MNSSRYSMQVLFAIQTLASHRYELTSTFTGDVFVPRAVVTNAAGERLGALPAQRPSQPTVCSRLP